MPIAARRVALLLVSIAAAAVPARAQDRDPIPLFVADLRAFNAGLGQDPVTAADLGVEPGDMPGRGWGAVAGAHVYPLRGRSKALGVGAELVLGRGRAQQENPASGEGVGIIVSQRLRGVSPQLSINFGHRLGWSYLTAGMGPLSFVSYLGDEAPTADPPSRSTINMGGGARWFTTDHVAFTLDVRFYLTRPAVSTEDYPARQRTRLLVMSAGVAFK
jgi:hypothetical protein